MLLMDLFLLRECWLVLKEGERGLDRRVEEDMGTAKREGG